MTHDRKKLPGVLMLLLSTLGFLFGIGAMLLVLFTLFLSSGSTGGFVEKLPIYSTALLSLLVALLNIPAFVLSIRYLQGKSIDVSVKSLFKPASFSLILWAGAVALGYFATQTPNAVFLAAVMTVIAVLLPVWWLVEFSRRKLPRSNAAREWGALAIGLTAAPLIIMVIEIVLLVLVGIAVFFALSTQPEALQKITGILSNIQNYQGSLDQLDQLINDLAQNPIVAGGLFLVIGLLAPFVEEFFKPMAVWFLLNRPLKNHEGFALGLISGGAFALIESASLVGQIGPDTWLSAVILRSGTGLLHIGLSGMVGYGMVKSWNEGKFARALLYWLAAGSIHGAWNSLALVSGFSTSPMSNASAQFQFTLGNVLPVAGMVLLFAGVLVIVLRINRDLRKQLAVSDEEAETPAAK